MLFINNHLTQIFFQLSLTLAVAAVDLLQVEKVVACLW